MSTYSDASLIFYPSGYKESKLYSLKPTDGSGDLTFTRASSATRVNEQGLIETASILGSEEVVNGDFATDTNWDLGSATISGGLLNLLGGGGLSYALQTNTNLVIGKRYLATYTIVSISNAGLGVRVRVGNGGNGIYRTTTGTFTEIITCAGSFEIFLEGNSTNFIGSIDNVSVKEVITNNIPRIDYTGGGCGKLLLEPQRTNLVLYSNNAFGNGTNGSSATTTTPSVIDGVNYRKMTATAVDGNIFAGVSELSSTPTGLMCFSVFLKKGSCDDVQLIDQNTTGKSIRVNLSNGTIISQSSGLICGVESYGNDVYRVYLVQDFTSIGFRYDLYAKEIGDFYYTTAQMESGSYPTSVIITNGTAVTRVSDVAGKSGISSLIGQTEGVVFYDFIWQATGQAFQSSGVSSGSYHNSISFGHYGGSLNLEIYYNGALIGLGSQVLIDGQRYKIAFAYKSGDSATYVNGVQLSTSSTSFAFAAVLNNLFLTYDGENFGDKVNTYMLFKTRLPNADLTLLTGTLGETYFESYALMANYLNYTIQ